MPIPVSCIDHKFEGFCVICDKRVTGRMITGEFPTIEGRNICVTGSIGLGDCGHTCISIGLSQVWDINDKPVVRIGDPVTGNIIGNLIEGWDFVTSD